MPEAAPAVGIAIELSGTNVLVRHQNGAVLPAGRYAVKVDGAEKDFQPAGVDFTPGMTLKWDAGDTAVGTVSVVAKDGAGETSLAQKYIGKAASEAPAVEKTIEEKYTFVNPLIAMEDFNGLDRPDKHFDPGHIYKEGAKYWVYYFNNGCDYWYYDLPLSETDDFNDKFREFTGTFTQAEICHRGDLYQKDTDSDIYLCLALPGAKANSQNTGGQEWKLVATPKITP